MKQNMTGVATELITDGISVMPTNADKVPTIPEWKPFQKRRMTPEEIKSNFHNGQGIGVICGAISGNTECLDIDQPELVEPFLNILRQRKPALAAKLVKQKTLRPGRRHLIYRSEKPVGGNTKLATSPPYEENGLMKKDTWIETRGEGGYFISAPTKGYEYLEHSLKEIPTITADEVHLIHTIAKSFTAEPEKPKYKKQVEVNGTRPGDDYRSAHDPSEILPKYGWKPTGKNGQGGQHWTRPGKDKGTSATLKEGCLYVFSSSTVLPMGPNDTFSIYAHYRHNGDFSAAAKELSKQGYGDRREIEGAQAKKEFPKAGVEPIKLIRFPYHIIRGAAGRFTDEMTVIMEPPAEFFFCAYLACLGNSLSGIIRLRSEIKDDPRLYLLLLGESASTRKSTAISKTQALFKAAIIDFNACRGVGSAEGLQNEMLENPQTLMVFDEFRAFVGKTRIKSSVLLPCVTTLFHENEYKNRTKTSAVDIIDGHLSILAASTVDTYQNCWSNEFTSIGFNNRLFIVPAKSTKRITLPPMVPDNTYRGLKNDIGEVISLANGIGIYRVEPDAEDLLDKWYQNREHSIFTRRLAAYARRFMLLLAANDLRESVEKDIVQDAIDLVEWQLKMRRLYDPIDAENKVALMEMKIKRLLEAHGMMTERQLMRHTHADRTGLWTFEAATNGLVKHGLITKFKRKTGKPGPNPLMYELIEN